MHNSNLTVLVADDDRTTRTVLASLLQKEGFRVELADRGEKCLFIAMEQQIDAFLIDIRMPGLGGLELCRKLRALDRYRITPIIFITALDEEDMLSAVFEAGATDFIAKPINPVVLKARLQGHIQKVEYYLEMERVRHYLNRYVSPRTQNMVEAYATTGLRPPPEQREVCVMFSDVRGFTALTRQTEPGILFDSLNHLLAMQVEMVYRHGGYIDKFGGDGIMAIFDTDSKASKACQCALAIMETANNMAAGGEDPIRLPIAIGIDIGPVLIGNIGSEEHLDYSAVGQSVNLASRLCSNAESMTIEVSGAVVAETAAEPFVFSSPIEVSIRGINEPVSIYRLK
ncbi:MAG: adenylate/guanylate cyclase domain-containing protein [Gammaproteobacteria bacterium]|nr:adenylate/guanylate cyclase domain-containing protein [Gammaproteobacteria bacterium]